MPLKLFLNCTVKFASLLKRSVLLNSIKAIVLHEYIKLGYDPARATSGNVSTILYFPNRLFIFKSELYSS